jgi:hypothetical protein
MRTGITIKITRPDRHRLEAITKDRNTSLKHVWRANIVLLRADGVGTNEIMRQTGTSKTCVWRWQQRFTEEGVDGRRCDALLNVTRHAGYDRSPSKAVRGRCVFAAQ